MFNGKRVLVTGGTGLVGRELVRILTIHGAKVTSVSLDENNFNYPYETPIWPVHYVRGDLRDPYVCNEVVRNQDYVFHIAGIKGSPVVVNNFQHTMFRDFIQMNTNMIEAMLNSETMEWGLYTSTVGTYGPADIFYEDELWDQMPSRNDWYAGWSKRMGEVQIDAYAEQYNKRNISIIKPVNIYGSFDNHDLRTSTLIPSLIRKVYESDDVVEIWGSGESQRDIIHARDVARAAKLVVEKREDRPVNVGNGVGVSIKEAILTTIKVSGKNLRVEHDYSKPTGDQNRIANISRLRLLGFESTVSLEDGLRETYEWYSQNVDENGVYAPTFKRYDPFYG